MMLRILIALCCLSCPVVAQEKPCAALESDHITGKDLARAIPEFSTMPPETVLSVSPLAGSRRTFHAEEISALAGRYSIKLESPKEACFEWTLEPLDRGRAIEAMLKSLGVPDAHIEIAEALLDRVPQGQIEFPREALGKPASFDQPSPVLWRGSISYGGGRRFAIWARVRITAPVKVIVAAEPLKVGQQIHAQQVKIVGKSRFPNLQDSAPALEQVAGMLPLHSIPAGGEVRFDNLIRPNDVSRGDLVAIEVRSGRTRLTFSGRAESAGHTGDMIAVRNPESNKIFRARVCAPGRAMVEAAVPDPSREN